jgi:hypothetical protein
MRNCPVAVAEAESLVKREMACYNCYFLVVALLVHAIFFLLVLTELVRSLNKARKESEPKELAVMHRGAKYLSAVLFAVDIVRSWSSPSGSGLVVHGSETLAWLTILSALQREESTSRASFRNILRAWWVALLGLSTMDFSAALLNGQTLDASFTFEMVLMSPFLVDLFR